LVLNSIIKDNETIASLVERYIGQVTSTFEKMHSGNTLLPKENFEQRELLEAPKKKKKDRKESE